MFPQRVTNTDLKFAVGLQAAAHDSAPVRAMKLQQAEERARQILSWAQADAQQLRQGAYYKPGGGTTRTASPGTPPPGRVPTAEINEAYARARDAIAKGADPAAVAKRLRDAGIDPSGL